MVYPYDQQRNNIAQSLMSKAFPGAGSLFGGKAGGQQSPGYQLDQGTGSGAMGRAFPQRVLQRSAGAPSGDMNPALTQQINAMPPPSYGGAPQTLNMGMPPPPPPQMQMPQSLPPPTQTFPQPTQAPLPQGMPSPGFLGSMPSMGTPDNFGAGAGMGSKGAGQKPPTPADMNTGM